MALPPKAIIGIMADNLRRRGSVLPLSRRKATGWAKGLDIPRGGETVIYTGHMYQLIPSISSMAAVMARLEDSFLTKFMGLGRIANRFIDISRIIGRASPGMQADYDRILRNIVLLLRAAGVEFGYLYEKELYTGALIHDEGVDGALEEHARRVRGVLAESGVKKVITVDPHTTHMLSTVFPRVLDDFDIEVRNYLQGLAEAGGLPAGGGDGAGLVVHESCVYTRYEGMIEEPRRLLEQAGFELSYPELSGINTHCCGGPVESLFPSRAHEIALKRLAQLEPLGKNVVAMCPICLVNLVGAAGSVSLRF